MKIRIAVAVDPTGTWNACGWGGPKSNATDKDKMGLAVEGVGDGERRFWIEAEVPDPGPAAVLPSKITAAE